MAGADPADVVWEDSVGTGAAPHYGRVYTYGGVDRFVAHHGRCSRIQPVSLLEHHIGGKASSARGIGFHLDDQLALIGHLILTLAPFATAAALRVGNE